MTKKGLYLITLLFIIATCIVIPAYAEVTSLTTNTSFYKGGSVIQFSGTTLSTDPPNVTLLIFDPTNKFVLLTSGTTDSNHTFQISVNTSVSGTLQQFSLKGVYNATAFIANKTDGKTVSFAFSPDGSLITFSPPTNLTATASSSTEINLNWLPPQNNGGLPVTGYKIERNDGNGFNIIANSQLTSYQDMGLVPNSEHSYRVSTINLVGSSAPSNTSIVFTLPAPTPTSTSAQNTSSSDNQNSNQSLNDLLQQRYADARKLQEMLNAQSSSQPNATSSSSSQPNATSSSSSQPNATSSSSASQPNATSSSSLLGGISNQSSSPSQNASMNNVAANQSAPTSSVQNNNSTSSSSANFAAGNVLYPVISLVGVGIVVTILYFRKKRKISSNADMRKDAPQPMSLASEQPDYDYAMAILKNRLAKGEITIDEFRILKDELSEP